MSRSVIQLARLRKRRQHFLAHGAQKQMLTEEQARSFAIERGAEAYKCGICPYWHNGNFSTRPSRPVRVHHYDLLIELGDRSLNNLLRENSGKEHIRLALLNRRGRKAAA